MSLSRTAGQLALMLILASDIACRSFGPEQPSLVAQGRYFSTGHPSYDEFFVRLHRMQVELRTAPEDVAEVRARLLQTLKLPPNAELATLEVALESRLSAAERRGVNIGATRARLDARPTLTVSGSPGAEDKALIALLTSSLIRLEGVRSRMKPWQAELEWLPSAGVELDGSVEAAFLGESRGTRDEVHENLTDAQKIIALMSSRAKEVERDEESLSETLSKALRAKASTPAPVTEAESPAPKARAEKPRPAAAPASAPAANKPKRGPAKPDFEP